MFEWWLHSEAGYQYIGETSFYKLTIPELKRLYRGFSIVKEQEQRQMDQANGGRARGRVRDSDVKALEKFKSQRGLE